MIVGQVLVVLGVGVVAAPEGQRITVVELGQLNSLHDITILKLQLLKSY